MSPWPDLWTDERTDKRRGDSGVRSQLLALTKQRLFSVKISPRPQSPRGPADQSHRCGPTPGLQGRRWVSRGSRRDQNQMDRGSRRDQNQMERGSRRDQEPDGPLDQEGPQPDGGARVQEGPEPDGPRVQEGPEPELVSRNQPEPAEASGALTPSQSGAVEEEARRWPGTF